MRIVFMGTPAFAVPSLAALIASGHEIAAVYTQPPRPSGRGHKVQKSPVHAFAEDHGLEIRHPDSLKSQDEKEAFAELEADVAIVVAYGLILPKAVLAAPRLGCLNLHGSLLPRWRGAAPIQRAIMAGDQVTGVQVMQMEAGLDTGPVLLSETVPITATDTAASLSEKLSHIGADMLPRVLAALDRGGIVPQIQPEEGVTYAHKISPEEARIDWSKPAIDIDAHIRGLTPVPGAWTLLSRDGEDVRLKIWEAAPDEGQGAPGTVLGSEAEGIKIAAGDGTALLVTKLQRPGKAAQDADTFLRGYPLAPGESLS
ncbi:methionyl-tRNA formyltransferase [Parvularcula marina]|uniref:methionyl-tRNA formyltransferase n=1 Tax=Parvularcula marina TaxID=2292771 RepID=UPI0035130DD4